MDELLDDFIAETRDTLELLSSQLVQWEKTPDDRALLDSVFRFVHTVKGSCGFLDLPRLLRLSHAAEDVLSNARDGLLHASPDLVTAVLAAIDQIAALTEALESGVSVKDYDAELIDAMMAFVVKLPAEAKLSDPIEPTNAEGDLEPGYTIIGKAKARSVRVSLAHLDNLMNGVSDMVLARNEVSRQLRKSGVDAELDHSFARLSSSVAEMRDAVSLMRMQNIDRLFSSLPRLVRDIGHELGKDIELQIEGGEVEVDREMVEALRDPLAHILRNSADHGIESAEERRSVGKANTGLIRIVARQSGNQIMVEIADDGHGIDLDKLGARAIAAQVISADAWQKLPEKAQLHMIFMPGLSTAERVSAISGRGVGMDVVPARGAGRDRRRRPRAQQRTRRRRDRLDRQDVDEGHPRRALRAARADDRDRAKLQRRARRSADALPAGARHRGLHRRARDEGLRADRRAVRLCPAGDRHRHLDRPRPPGARRLGRGRRPLERRAARGFAGRGRGDRPRRCVRARRPPAQRPRRPALRRAGGAHGGGARSVVCLPRTARPLSVHRAAPGEKRPGRARGIRRTRPAARRRPEGSRRRHVLRLAGRGAAASRRWDRDQRRLQREPDVDARGTRTPRRTSTRPSRARLGSSATQFCT